MYAQESIDLLSKSGIQFQKNLESGIDPMHFAELLTSSGVVLIDKVTWISFHSSYDFGYLIKLLTNKDLPNTEVEFLEYLKLFFPNVFDIKYLMKSCRNLKGGLEEVARQLEVNQSEIYVKVCSIFFNECYLLLRLNAMDRNIKQAVTVYSLD